MEEIWKDVEGFEDYQISSMGSVYSKKVGRLLAQQPDKKGYLRVKFSKHNKGYTFKVHRLVAQAFISNPDNLPQINHKDEIITNNSVDNLEWCTPKYNANYGTRNQRCVCKQQFRPVIQLSKDGMFIKRWKNITSASKALGIDMSQISGVCRHKKEYVTAGGFKWEYALS